jgi:hypothetical protein
MRYFIAANDKVEPCKPLYTHDCDDCVFLGRIVETNKEPADVYHCWDTLTVQYSGVCSDYLSCNLQDHMQALLTGRTSDLHWLVCQLVEKGILTFTAAFNNP